MGYIENQNQSKKKFLFTTLPTDDLGLLTRSLPIAKELSRRGHHIVFSHPASSPRKVIAEANFENLIPVHPLYEIGFSGNSLKTLLALFTSSDKRNKYGGSFRFLTELIKSVPLKRAPYSDDIWDMDHAFTITGLLSKNFIKSQCHSYINVIKTAHADAVIDFWNPFVGIACRKLAMPLITINQGDALPNSKGFVWWKKKPNNIPSVTPVINRILRDYGLSEITKTEELNVGDLSLVVGMPETDPLEGVHNYKYIGPVIWQHPNQELPTWFNTLPKDKPIIWIYSGNPRYGTGGKMFNSDKMLFACIEALTSDTYGVVLSTGHHQLPKDLKKLPDNFLFSPYVPGLLMAERCDLMIHHGGYGSCQTGLYTGTPALILPTFSERESNARRIAMLGAGECILPSRVKKNEKNFDVDEIRLKVEKILSDQKYVINAKECSRKLKSYGGPVKTADLIENFMKMRKL